MVRREFEVEVVSRKSTVGLQWSEVVYISSRWFTVVRSEFEVEVVTRKFMVGLQWFEVVQSCLK